MAFVVPAFVIERRDGLLDYWAVHEQLLASSAETSIERALRRAHRVSSIPEAMVTQLADHARRSGPLLRAAILSGDWQPYIEQMRALGARYAELGVPFEGWYTAIRMFQRRLIPALVEEYAASPTRLTDALAVSAELLDFLTEVVADRYFEVREEDRFRLLLDSVKDYAIYMLDPHGVVTSWNAGAEMIKGYAAAEVIGHHFSMFFSSADRETGKPQAVLDIAAATGRFEEQAVRIRKDGTVFWADVVVTAIRGDGYELVGFAKVVRDLSERRRIEATLEHRTRELESVNRELEAFSYSVAHDLRAPLRAMAGLSQALVDDHGAALDPTARHHLARIRASAQRMSALIDALLDLSRLARSRLQLQRVDASELARQVIGQLVAADPARVVDVAIDDGLIIEADPRLLRTLLDNLIGNAWKFTARTAGPQIAVGRHDAQTWFVRDNGAGFDPAHAGKLFTPFERLHSDAEFAGTGIGLAIVHRIVQRHGGRIWAEARPGLGATFLFTLSAPVSG